MSAAQNPATVATGTVADLCDVPAAARDLTRTSDDLYSHERWLRIEEDAHPGSHFYAWAENTTAAAFAAAYRFDRNSNPWTASRLDLFLAEYADAGNAHQALPNYLLGGRRPGHSHILCDAPKDQRRDLLTRLVGAAAEAARQDGAASIAALYCDRDDNDLAAAFAEHGGLRFPAPGLNALHLPGSTADDWIASLPSGRRNTVRAERRKLETAGVTYDLRPLTAADVTEIVSLELSQYRKYGHNYHEAEAKALHLAYLDHLGPDALVVRALRDGNLIGFVSIVRHGRVAYLRQGGFDADACADAPVYFGAVFHEPIAWAYHAGVDALDLSISADTAKQHRRARHYQRHAWVIPLTAAASKALGPLSNTQRQPSPDKPHQASG